jgi:amidase
MKQSVLIAAALLLLPTGIAAQDSQSPPAGNAERNVLEAFERIGTLNPSINAVIAVDPTAPMQGRLLDSFPTSHGPLYGMPILLKDNIEAAGPLPTTAGSLALRHNVTNRDAPLVARLRAAGAIIIGKTNLSEWANIRSSNSISGWSAVGGQTRNPHALDRNPCGSSSGSAAAVAAGMVPVAIGTETDGSVVCPAAINGIVGMKPTVGLVSRRHIVPISHSQDTAGPLARTVLDAARVLTVMAGTDPEDQATAEADTRRQDYAALLNANSLAGARIGVMRFATGFGTDGRFEEALAVLRERGAVLVDIDAVEGRREMRDSELIVLLAELRAGLNAYLATTRPQQVATRTLSDVIAFNTEHAAQEMALFGQDIFIAALDAPALDDQAYLDARATSLRLAGAEGIDRMLAEHDLVALVGPTEPAAWPIDPVHGDQISGGGGGGLAAIAGYPHLTVPMGLVRGLPVGLSFIGPQWSDGLILSLGYAYEQASQLRADPQFLPSVEAREEIEAALGRQTIEED